MPQRRPVGATLSRPTGARSPIPNPARLRFLRPRWRPTPRWRPVPTRTRPSGNRHGDDDKHGGDDKHGRRQASPLREQLGDEARVGATLAVAHPESSTAPFPSPEVASHAPVASRTDPNEAIGKPAWGRRQAWRRRQAWARQASPLREQLGDEARDRVGVTGLRPSPLPHHRTCGFLASGGWRRWTSPKCVHEVSFIQRVHSQPFACPVPAAYGRLASRNPPVGSPSAAVHCRRPVRQLSGQLTESGCQPVSCACSPSLQPLSRPSSLLRPLLTSARLSTGRSPRVRCMNSRAGPSDSTQCAFR